MGACISRQHKNASRHVVVANGTNGIIRAKVAVDKTKIKEIEGSASLGLDAIITLKGSVKASLEHQLNEAGFATIAPNQRLAFDFGPKEKVYVTIANTDVKNPTVMCYNYPPPSGRSVIVTEMETIQLAEPGSHWCTDEDVCYGPRSSRPSSRLEVDEQNAGE